MLSRFFIDRPIFAWVIAIFIALAGVLAIVRLPVEQYPSIAPPQVVIQTTYPGASADTAQNSVTQVIEQQLTGIDNLMYFASTTGSTGQVQITSGSDILLVFDTAHDLTAASFTALDFV